MRSGERSTLLADHPATVVIWKRGEWEASPRRIAPNSEGDAVEILGPGGTGVKGCPAAASRAVTAPSGQFEAERSVVNHVAGSNGIVAENMTDAISRQNHRRRRSPEFCPRSFICFFSVCGLSAHQQASLHKDHVHDCETP